MGKIKNIKVRVKTKPVHHYVLHAFGVRWVCKTLEEAKRQQKYAWLIHELGRDMSGEVKPFDAYVEEVRE